MAAPAPPDAGPTLFHIVPGVDNEIRLAVAYTQSFVAGFLPGFLWLVVFGLVALFSTWGIVFCCGHMLRFFRAPSNCRQLTQIGLGLVLLYTGISIAFGSVGISFSWLFIGSSFVVGLALGALSEYAGAFVTGILLHLYNVLDGHKTVVLGKERGKFRHIGLFVSEFVPETSYAPADKVGPERETVHETLLVLNTDLLRMGLRTIWKTDRSVAPGSEAGRRYPSAEARANFPQVAHAYAEAPPEFAAAAVPVHRFDAVAAPPPELYHQLAATASRDLDETPAETRARQRTLEMLHRHANPSGLQYRGHGFNV